MTMKPAGHSSTRAHNEDTPIMTLDEVVRGYIGNYRDKFSRGLRLYAIQRSLQEAISMAALAQTA